MKNVFVLSHDYWHHSESIVPLMSKLFDDGFDVKYTTNPENYYECTPDLFVSFKDPIENDQIPTPVWCDEMWTEKFLKDVEAGMGVLLLHAALTDLPEGHLMLVNIIKSTFLTHPEQCPVTFLPLAEHPIFEGVEKFTFPTNDEHYVMEFLDGAGTQLIANTESVNGIQPGMWIHEYGKGRICCITPGHNTENLTYAPFVHLLQNAVRWCMETGNHA